MIKAEAHSDDHVFTTTFDATAYFEQASDQQISELQACGFGGDYPADAVAQFHADTNKDLEAMFDYLARIANDPSKKDCSGFECHVDESDAQAWINANRPHLIQE
jgi:hypothetical protein